jgi:hypothetical protein
MIAYIRLSGPDPPIGSSRQWPGIEPARCHIEPVLAGTVPHRAG